MEILVTLIALSIVYVLYRLLRCQVCGSCDRTEMVFLVCQKESAHVRLCSQCRQGL